MSFPSALDFWHSLLYFKLIFFLVWNINGLKVWLNVVYFKLEFLRLQQAEISNSEKELIFSWSLKYTWFRQTQISSADGYRANLGLHFFLQCKSFFVSVSWCALGPAFTIVVLTKTRHWQNVRFLFFSKIDTFFFTFSEMVFNVLL